MAASAIVTDLGDDKHTKAITEEEAQLYDRQIRLWGLDAQKRLRAARVLIAGLKGLGCEVAKNLVLAGINSLTILDHEALTPEDGESQFLAPRDKVGQNRAEASLERLQKLNPGVEIKVDKDPVEAKPDEFFSAENFDLVLMTNCSKDTMLRIDEVCRAAKVGFFAGDVFGHFGYSFMDLEEHHFLVEEVKQAGGAVPVPEKNGRGDCPEEPPAKKVAKQQPEETKLVKNVMKFVSLKKALGVDWTTDANRRRLKRMDPSYLVLQVLYEFQSREGRPPSPDAREADLQLLTSLRDSVASKMELAEDCKFLGRDGDRLLNLLFSQLSPVAAIVGGILAQEIIKVISNRDAPHNNFFLYNPLDSCGVVEAIGY